MHHCFYNKFSFLEFRRNNKINGLLAVFSDLGNIEPLLIFSINHHPRDLCRKFLVVNFDKNPVWIDNEKFVINALCNNN